MEKSTILLLFDSLGRPSPFFEEKSLEKRLRGKHRGGFDKGFLFEGMLGKARFEL